MDLGHAKGQLLVARTILEEKGAPLKDTAAGRLILALEAVITELEHQFGYTRPGKPGKQG